MTGAVATPEPSATSNRVLEVASTFTARLLAKSLRPFLVESGIADSVAFIEYGQITEYMLGPASAAEDVLGTLVLIRIEDALRNEFKSGEAGSEASAVARKRLATHVDEVVKQLTTVAKHGKPVWLLVCPSNGWIAESCKLTDLCRTYTNLLLARVRKTINLTVLGWPESLSSHETNDRNADRLGQIPWSSSTFKQLGEFLGAEIESHFASYVADPKSISSNGKADLANFLAGLNVCVRFHRPSLESRAHFDRILRTAAAFSLTGEKRELTDAEVDCLLETRECWLVSVSDRLSNYGPSGAVVVRYDSDSMIVEALALSCPVLGKQVEYAVVSALAEMALSKGLSGVVFQYKASGRNQIMLKFLEGVADAGLGTQFELAANEAALRIAKAATAPGTWTLDFGT